MNGSILIPNMTGPLTRVEIQFNFTHLSENVMDGFILREWLSVDWGAGDLSGHWEIIIVHDPPRWSPDDRTRAAFIPSDGGKESRTGPWIFIETLLDHALNARGCLPDSSRCKGFPSRDIILTANYRQVRSLDDLESIIRTAESEDREAVLLRVQRRGQPAAYVAVRLR